MKKYRFAHIKRLFVLLGILCTTLYSYGSPAFTGVIGTGVRIQPESQSLLEFISNFKLPKIYTESFFASHISFSPNLVMRAEFSILTDSIIGDKFLTNIPSSFSLNELSLSYIGSVGTTSQYASLFFGETDPIGSDLFLRRLFGIPSFTSRILETDRRLSCAQLYPMSGMGASYALKTSNNFATALYCYYNKTEIVANPLADSESSLNIDLRLAAASPWALIDLSAGLTLPFEKKDVDGNRVILLIRKADFHAGLSVFFGSSHTSSLLLQAGLIKLVFSPVAALNEKIVIFEDVTLLIEPRIKLGNFWIALSAFNLPPKVGQNLFYIEHPLGANVSLFYTTFDSLGFEGEMGLHGTLTKPDYDLDFSPAKMTLQIAPYIKAEIRGGSLNTTLRYKMHDLTKLSFDIGNINLSIGYKTHL